MHGIIFMEGDMLDTIKAKLRITKLSNDERAEFIREMNFTNFKRFRIFTIVLIPIFIILVVLDLMRREQGLWDVPGHLLLFYVHAITLALFLLLAISFFLRPPGSAGGVTLRHRATGVSLLTVIIVSQMLTTFADLQIRGQATVYAVFAFGIGAVVLLRNAGSLAIYAACLFLFVAGTGRYVDDPAKAYGLYLNGTILTVIAWVLSRVVYSGYRQNFIHEKKIRRQNEDMRAMADTIHLSERRLADIIDFLPIATFVIDRGGKITAWNRALEQMTGAKAVDMIGKGNYEYSLPFYGKRRPILVDRVFSSEEELRTRYSHVRREGNILEAESYIPKLDNILLGFASPLYDEDGTIIGAIESIRDITRIRQVEVELKEAKEAAVAASRSKSAFLANMSHEIRTPMNAILGFAQLMQRDPALTPQLQEQLAVINRSGEHLLSLINDILEMSKIEAGRSAFAPKTFDLHGLLDELEAMFRVRCAAKKLSLLFERIGEVPRWVVTDESKLRQVLINLVGNAVKFTDEGGIALRTGVRRGEGKVELMFEVEDTGPGLSEEEIDQLFQAFEQAGAGRRSGGTGLGLALSRGFVQLMGGALTLTSTVGKGSIFRFTIPVRPGKEEDAGLREAKRRVLRVKPGGEDIRILIADDRETNRQLLTQLLAKVGFRTREAVNGEEAVAAFREWNPQVILMDMTMPVMDGYEATRIIKSDPSGMGTAVIAVTASAFDDDRQRVLAAGADGYLAKPFKEADLFEIIRGLTGVEYQYDEGEGTVPEQPVTEDAMTLLREAVAGLPPDLVHSLLEATLSADIGLLNELIDQVSHGNARAAQMMREMAAHYRYEELFSLLS